MKNRYIKCSPILWASMFVILVLAACKGSDDTLGINLLPGTSLYDSRYYEEKGTISAYTFADEKVRVDRPKYNMLGSFNDPLFGRTDGSFAAQFRLPYHPDFDPTSAVDSVVLRMSYKIVYGDTVSAQTLNVYELDKDLVYDATYLSSFNPKSLASASVIGSTTFIPKFKTDSTKSDTTEQVIRIRMNPSIGQKLLAVDSVDMISNETFLKKFKGMYIEPMPLSRKGALVGVVSSNSGMLIYYHTAQKDSLSFYYLVTDNSANVSAFNHDYSQSQFYTHLNQENVQDSLIYVQPLAGIKAKVNVPSLSQWADSSNFLINKATITFHVDTLLTDINNYEIPARIYLKIKDDSGNEIFPKDSELANSYYGGFYNYLDATYSFNITQHLQQIIDGDIANTSFYLVHSDRNGVAKRVVLKGATSATPMRLNVSYTKYK